jgi:signal transduction histidine kinase
MAELRELARGIHPAVLTEAGLGPALRALARRSALNVLVQEAPEERLPGPIEAAAYFVVAESLTNAAKHAGAHTVTVRASCEAGVLRLEVADDGIGGADASRGSGLEGLADRVGALDGQLEVISPAGGGTRVVVCIPCA